MNTLKNLEIYCQKNNILPFLSNYNYDLVISKIEKRIKCSERIDSNFIDSL